MMQKLWFKKCCKKAKSLVAELASPHAQSAWGSKGEMVQVAGLAACCNYFSKNKMLQKHMFIVLIIKKVCLVQYFKQQVSLWEKP